MLHLLIAVNRLTAFFWPFKHSSMWSIRVTAWTILVALLASAILHIVPYYALPLMGVIEWETYFEWLLSPRAAVRPRPNGGMRGGAALDFCHFQKSLVVFCQRQFHHTSKVSAGELTTDGPLAFVPRPRATKHHI